MVLDPGAIESPFALPVAAIMTVDPALAERMVAALAGVATVIRADPASESGLSVVEATRPSLVAVDAEDMHADLASQVTRLRSVLPNAVIVALGDERMAEQVLAAVRAGAQDLIDREMTELGLRRALRPRLERRQLGPQSDRQAPCFAIIGARAEDNSREVALAIACLRAKAGKQVLLLDLAPAASEVELALDLHSTYGVGDALRDIDRLDGALLKSAVPRDAYAGLSALLVRSPDDLQGVGSGDLRSLLLLLRSLYAEVVLHLGAATPGSPQLALASGLRRFGLVMTQSVGSASAASTLMQTLDQPGLQRRDRIIGIIADHDKAIQLPATRIAAELELADPILFADMRVTMLNAINSGQLASFLCGNRAVQRTAEQLGNRLSDVPADAPAGRRFFPWSRSA